MTRVGLLLVGLVLVGCVDEDASRRTLRGAGYTQVTLTGWSPSTCGRDDAYSTGFTARGPSGVTVDGVVCCGLLFKNCTIRH